MKQWAGTRRVKTRMMTDEKGGRMKPRSDLAGIVMPGILFCSSPPAAAAVTAGCKKGKYRQEEKNDWKSEEAF